MIAERVMLAIVDAALVDKCLGVDLLASEERSLLDAMAMDSERWGEVVYGKLFRSTRFEPCSDEDDGPDYPHFVILVRLAIEVKPELEAEVAAKLVQQGP